MFLRMLRLNARLTESIWEIYISSRKLGRSLKANVRCAWRMKTRNKNLDVLRKRNGALLKTSTKRSFPRNFQKRVFITSILTRKRNILRHRHASVTQITSNQNLIRE